MNGHYILKLNNKCNMNCLFCADSSEIRRMPDKDFDELREALSNNRKKFDSLIITGGEPTIYKRLFSIIKHAKRVCQYNHICLVSNGLLLSNEIFLDELIKAGVDSFQISYFALDEKKYTALSRTPNMFCHASKAIMNIIKRKNSLLSC